MNSPMLPSAMVPNSSAATTLTMLRAKRCSLMASAAPSISLEEATTNSPSFTTSAAAPARPRPSAPKVKSRWAAWPAATATPAVCTGRPV